MRFNLLNALRAVLFICFISVFDRCLISLLLQLLLQYFLLSLLILTFLTVIFNTRFLQLIFEDGSFTIALLGIPLSIMTLGRASAAIFDVYMLRHRAASCWGRRSIQKSQRDAQLTSWFFSDGRFERPSTLIRRRYFLMTHVELHFLIVESGEATAPNSLSRFLPILLRKDSR